jgi:hypothetical protein
MKKLIFILLKIVEVVLVYVIVGYTVYDYGYKPFFNWLDNILGWHWMIIINNIILFLSLVLLVKRGHLKAWIQSNKKWSENIVNKLKRQSAIREKPKM